MDWHPLTNFFVLTFIGSFKFNCFFIFFLKSATIIQYTIKGRFMSR